MKKIPLQLFALLSACMSISLSSVHANDILPAPKQEQALLFKNGTIHTLSQGTVKNADLLVENGKIVKIGMSLSADGAKIIDVSNKHIYPGIVALDTSIGLVEVSAVRESDDRFEIGEVNPQLSVTSAYNADSEVIPTVRHNGVTYAQIVPAGSGIAGQSAVVNLDAWNIQDALVDTDLQMHLYWPKINRPSNDKDEYNKQKQKLAEQVQQVVTAFEDGYRYQLLLTQGKPPIGEQSLAAMAPLYKGKGQLYVHADTQEQIEQTIALARKYRFKLVIVGGYDAWRSAVAINEIGAKVIYTHTFGLPLRPDEPIDQAFKIPALLKQAQIPFALGYSSSWDSRNLPFAAGYTVAYGLSKQEALQTITLDAAKIMGINNIGDIASGYRASFIISNGDILDPNQAKVEQVYIDGRHVDLNNRQQQLYQKYQKR